MNTARKHRPELGLFDAEQLRERVAATDHPLWRINEIVEWERFQPIIDGVFNSTPNGPGGRPSYDRMMMFKILILKQLYNIPDEQMEQRLLGDLFFRHFLGLTFSDPTPDQKTIWLFQDTLSDAGVILDLFDAFNQQLATHRLMTKSGVIIDATIVPVPVQHISSKDRETLDKGEIPEEWIKRPAIARQRDTDAEWTKKHGKSYFGYKNHIKVDKDEKLIQTWEVTPANDHDSQPLPTLLDEEQDASQELYADAAYVGEPIRRVLRGCKMKDRRHKKAFKNSPLNDYQKRQNRRKSKIRARVEHVFGAVRMQMSDIRIRNIGRIRATFVIGMRNLIYNIRRWDYLRRAKAQPA
jgi:transposase, IS5 family